MRICSIEGCNRKHRARDLCKLHYEIVTKKGKNKFPPIASLSRYDVFLSKIQIVKDCWIWQGCKLKNGYGLFYLNRKQITTHRYSYLHHKGEIPENLCVLHICDTPSCVNPSHLVLGSQQDNLKDMIYKRRNNAGKEESHGKAKLKNCEVVEIKKMLKENKKTSEISLVFNVSTNCIRQIRNNLSWKNIIVE